MQNENVFAASSQVSSAISRDMKEKRTENTE